MAVSVKTNAGEVAVDYGTASKLVAANAFQRLRSIGATLVRAIAKDKLSAGGAAGTGQGLVRRTGNLTRALFYKLRLQGTEMVLTVGADGKKAAYAAIQEEGGTVRPVRSENLAIPLDAARTARGVARMSAREFIANPQALGFDGTFVNPMKTAIMGVKGETIQPVFALKKEVRIPARHYIRDTVFERRTWILEELGAAAADGANGTVEESRE